MEQGRGGGADGDVLLLKEIPCDSHMPSSALALLLHWHFWHWH